MGPLLCRGEESRSGRRRRSRHRRTTQFAWRIYLAVSGAEPLAIVAALLIGLAAVGAMLLVFVADTAWRAIGVARDLVGREPPETSR